MPCAPKSLRETKRQLLSHKEGKPRVREQCNKLLLRSEDGRVTQIGCFLRLGIISNLGALRPRVTRREGKGPARTCHAILLQPTGPYLCLRVQLANLLGIPRRPIRCAFEAPRCISSAARRVGSQEEDIDVGRQLVVLEGDWPFACEERRGW